MATTTKNDVQTPAGTGGHSALDQRTITDLTLALEQERAKSAGLAKELDGAVKHYKERITVLETQLVGLPAQARIEGQRARPGAIVMSDGKRLVLSHVATYGPLGKTGSIQFRARDGAVLAQEDVPKHRDNQPIPEEERLAIVRTVLSELDDLFGVE